MMAFASPFCRSSAYDYPESLMSHPRLCCIRSVIGLILVSMCPLIQAQEPSDPAVRLHQLFDADWQRLMAENPTWASSLGDRRYNQQWEDASQAAIEASARETRKTLQLLDQIPLAELSRSDQLNYRLFKQQCENRIADHELQLHFMPLNQRGGIQDQSTLADSLRFDSLQDYEDWLARLQAFPVYMDQTIALMRRGIETKMLHPKVVMKRVPSQIRQQIVERPEDSLYFAPFKKFQTELSDADKERLRKEAAKVIGNQIIPKYRLFLDFFEKEYLAESFDEVGCWQRPDGHAMYARLAKKFTTTNLTPQQIHNIGQSEVARIRAEMQEIQKQVKFKGSFQEFLVHLRTDRQFYYSNPNDLLKAYKECCRRIDPRLPDLFHRLPKAPYEITPIPAQMAPDTTTAYYMRPAADGSRPGRYYVNLYRPQDRPIYEIEALSLHEAVPGHHFQIALAMELEVPEFRRYGGYTAFIEGWGLYSEKLGEELGLYKDPYSKFGQLTYEMWRAVRLVVDTGMHSLKWTRQDAIDFFKQNTAKSILDIENEVDRYIAWPGQALAYKIGELKIRELRARAEKELGDRFDVRDFHAIVLRDGAVPLDVLESNVNEWLTKLKQENAGVQPDWGQFRGPGGRGIAETTLPASDAIGPEGSSLLWRAAVAKGHSSPVIAGDRVFVTANDKKRLSTIALDRRTGKVIWEQDARADKLESVHRIGSPATATVAANSQLVISMFGSCGLWCYDHDGNRLWHLPMGPFNNSFGAASSPLLVDNRVILVQDHDTDSFLAVYNAATGDRIWKAERPNARRNYCTPCLWTVDGRRQIVVCGSAHVTGYDYETGDVVWVLRGVCRVVSTTPVVGDDNHLYLACTGGQETEQPVFAEVLQTSDGNNNGVLEPNELPKSPIRSFFDQFDRDASGTLDNVEYNSIRDIFSLAQTVAMRVQPGGTGDITDTHVAWSTKQNVPRNSSPVCHDGLMFMVRDGGICTTLNQETGELLHRARLVDSGKYYSSPLVADGRLFALSERGRLSVISAEAEWKRLGQADFKEDVYACPAAADGCLYIRTAGHLYCFGRAQK